MLPATGAILLADGFQTAGIVETGHGEFVAVHGDAVELGDDAAGIFIFDEVVGELKHGAVEGKVGAEGCVLADGVHVARNPVVALLRTGGSAGDGQCEGKKYVAEATGQHRRYSIKLRFGKKVVTNLIFFTAGQLRAMGLTSV